MTSNSSVQQPTVNEWFALPPMQLLHSSDLLVSNNVQVYSAQLNPTSEYYAAPRIEDDFLVLLLNGHNFIEASLDDGKPLAEHLLSGSLQVVPRNMSFSSRWNGASKAAFIQVPRVVTNDLIAAEARGDPENVEIPFAFNLRDPLLFHLCQALVKQIETSSPNGLYSESLVQTIAAHLIYEYANATKQRPMTTCKLTAQQKRMIEEYICAHIHKNFSISELAHVLHLSTSHFQKVFRATFQCSPHQYVLERQIEKAKSLLSTRRLSLYEIARECGFANQSHFTKYFSRLVGVSPTRFIGR